MIKLFLYFGWGDLNPTRPLDFERRIYPMSYGNKKKMCQIF